MKRLRFNQGDIVLFKEIKGYYGSGKGCVRKSSLRHAVGLMGEIISVYPSAILYPYTVKFEVPYKKPTRNGDKSRILYFRLMESEVDVLFKQ